MDVNELSENFFGGKLTHVCVFFCFHIQISCRRSETDSLLSKPSSEEKHDSDPKKSDAAEKKMSNSKQLSKEQAEIESHIEHGGSVASIFYSAAKKVAVVGAVYFIGYMNWSVSWKR